MPSALADDISDGLYTEQRILSNGIDKEIQLFTAVDISEDDNVALIGISDDFVYVFENIDNSWTETSKIKSKNTKSAFGYYLNQIRF